MNVLDAQIEHELTKPGRLSPFQAPLEQRYQRDIQNDRRRHLALCLFLGTASFNSFLFWQLLLGQDDFRWVALEMLGTSIPVASLACLLVYKVSARWREWVAMLPSYTGLAVVYHIIIYGTKMQSVDQTLFIFCWPLMLVYANTCMKSPFPVVLAYNIYGLALTSLAVYQAGVSATTGGLMLTAAWSSAFFSLLGNYWSHIEGRRGYLYQLRERVRAEWLNSANLDLQRLAETDPLTGLANRRRIQPYLDRLWEQHARGESEGAALLIDIDYFKRFNDHYGHLMGDACLRSVAAALHEALRPQDMIARYGGEEFIVLLIDIQPAQAQMIAERLLNSIRALNLPHVGRTDGVGHLTISVGLAPTGLAAVQSSAQLLEQADRALYRAKRDGRDRWEEGNDAEVVPLRGAGASR